MKSNKERGRLSGLQKVENQPNPIVWNRLESKLLQRRKEQNQRVFNISVAAALVIISTVVASQFITTPEPEAQTAQQIESVDKDSVQKPQLTDE